jgi:hypothetical protein
MAVVPYDETAVSNMIATNLNLFYDLAYDADAQFWTQAIAEYSTLGAVSTDPADAAGATCASLAAVVNDILRDFSKLCQDSWTALDWAAGDPLKLSCRHTLITTIRTALLAIKANVIKNRFVPAALAQYYDQVQAFVALFGPNFPYPHTSFYPIATMKSVCCFGDATSDRLEFTGKTDANLVQTVTITGGAGTFTVAYSGQTTGALAWNISLVDFLAALEGLSNLAPGDVVVTGTPGDVYTLTFGGTITLAADVIVLGAGGATAVQASASSIAWAAGATWATLAVGDYVYIETLTGATGFTSYIGRSFAIAALSNTNKTLELTVPEGLAADIAAIGTTVATTPGSGFRFRKVVSA